MPNPKPIDLRDFEWIADLSKEFRNVRPEDLTPMEAAHWQLRIGLAIAQQLSVIAAVLKDGGR